MIFDSLDMIWIIAFNFGEENKIQSFWYQKRKFFSNSDEAGFAQIKWPDVLGHNIYMYIVNAKGDFVIGFLSSHFIHKKKSVCSYQKFFCLRC